MSEQPKQRGARPGFLLAARDRLKPCKYVERSDLELATISEHAVTQRCGMPVEP
jgi:hypothetical protein